MHDQHISLAPANILYIPFVCLAVGHIYIDILPLWRYTHISNHLTEYVPRSEMYQGMLFYSTKIVLTVTCQCIRKTLMFSL